MEIVHAGRVTFRSADESDAPALAELSTQLGYPTRPEQALSRLKGIGSKRDHAIIVAQDGQGGVIGFVHVHERVLLEIPPFGELGGLAVDRDHQQRGIGRRLLGAAERWSIARGLTSMRIRTNVVRDHAHVFYARMGYQAQKKQTIFVKDLSGTDPPME